MTPTPIRWDNSRVTVMGLGSFGGGAGLARYLAQQGADVTVTDLKPAAELRESISTLQDLSVRLILGEHREADFVDTDVVFVNPAVPLTSRYLDLARAHGVRLDSEINLFVRQCPGRIVGITGSVGKSTTTSFLGSILRQHDERTLVGGNIGGSLLPHLPEITPETPVVLELSSFQLEHLAWQRYSPPLAIVLNLAPNHLDRHGDMGTYQQAKEVIFAHQTPTDAVILNWDDPTVRDMGNRRSGRAIYYSMETALKEGVYHDPSQHAVVYAEAGQSRVLFHPADLSVPGAHNIGNAAAAAAAAVHLGVASEAITRGLQKFQGLTHRLEYIATKRGVCYYNDSKATTPISTIRALESFNRTDTANGADTAPPLSPQEPTLVLLAGGYDKHTPFDELARAIHRNAKAVAVYGDTAAQLTQDLARSHAPSQAAHRAHVMPCDTLEDALRHAITIAAPGDVILLSPACASYDQFPNYEARGERFRTLVQALPDT